MDNERQLKDIKEDMKVIISNRLNMSQSKLLFMGLIYEIILRRDLFPNNSNLKPFINKVVMKYLSVDEPFKDYLYDSRTLLGARIQKNIQSDVEYLQIIQMVKEIYEIFPKDEMQKNKNKKNRNMNKDLIEWMNFIEDKNR